MPEKVKKLFCVVVKINSGKFVSCLVLLFTVTELRFCN